jgi:hypothetical protein
MATEAASGSTGAARLEFAFADSELLALQPEDDGLNIVFSAAWVLLQTVADAPVQNGYLRGLQLQLQGVAHLGLLPTALGRLKGGSVVGSATAQRQTRLDLPGHWSGPLALELELAQGPALQWSGSGLVALLQPGWSFLESLAC